MDLTIAKVSVSFLKIVLKVLIIVLIVGYVGFETASLSAVILSLGTGISLAVQGTLSNFAGGVIIVIMRPFKIGAIKSLLCFLYHHFIKIIISKLIFNFLFLNKKTIFIYLINEYGHKLFIFSFPLIFYH